MMIGAAVRAQLDALEVNDQGDRFLGYGYTSMARVHINGKGGPWPRV